MQLFNRDAGTATVSLKYNCAQGSGNTFRDIAETTITVPACLFMGVTSYEQYRSYSSGLLFYFICNRQLTTSEKNVSITETSSTTGYTATFNYALGETHLTQFSNDMTSQQYRVALSDADITKANATTALINLYVYELNLASRMCSYIYQMPEQTDFSLAVDGVPCILADSNYPDSANVWTNHCYGSYLNGKLTLSGYLYKQDAWDSWTGAPSYGGTTYNYFGRAEFFYLWSLANGDLDADLDIETPFNPLPTDFYIEVTAQTDGKDRGEQGLNFTWEPQNVEELADIDLQNVTLNFDFYIGDDYEYTVTVPYSQDGYSTNFRTLYEMMGVPFYKNILNKLPLPDSWNDTNIYCSIWWSDVTGDAGKCLYVIGYDGNNSISVDKAQDTETGYWTYLTADEGDGGQDYNPDPNPYDDLSDFGGGTDAVNGSALLTTSYALSVSGAHDFGAWLWGTGLDLTQLKMVVNNPIENIVACKLFPFSLTGTASTVKLGNLTSPVNAYLLPENVARTFDMGTVSIHRKYNSFLDYAPYTTVRIYLPYLGLHELDTNVVMGQTIRVKYYVDLVTGHCRAIIFLDGTTLKKIQQIDGMIGQDVPVVGSNRAQVEAGYIVGGAQAVANFVGGIGNAIMGNIGSGLADIGNAVKGGLQTAMQQYHTYTSGTPSPALSRFDEQKICVFVDRPVYTEPSKFRHQNGKMCNLTCKLGTLSGYTVIDNTVDLSSIPCNKEERDELLKLLTSGIYL